MIVCADQKGARCCHKSMKRNLDVVVFQGKWVVNEVKSFGKYPLNININDFEAHLKEAISKEEHDLDILLPIESIMKTKRLIPNGDLMSIQLDSNLTYYENWGQIFLVSWKTGSSNASRPIHTFLYAPQGGSKYQP